MEQPARLPDPHLTRLIRGAARYAFSAMALISFGLLLFSRLFFWSNIPSRTPALATGWGSLGLAFTLMSIVFTDQLRNRAGWRIVPLMLALLLALFLLGSQ